MLITLIFSKDRPMQLDATLRSFFLHCLDPRTTQVQVLYKASEARSAAQYELLKRDYPQVRFYAQKHFRRDTFNLLDPFEGRSRIYRVLTLTGAGGFRIGTRPDLWLRRFIDTPRLSLVRRLFPAVNPQAAILFLVDDNLFVRDFSLASILTSLSRNPAALGFSLRLGQNTTYSYSANQPQALPHFNPLPENTLKFNWPGTEGDFGYPLEVSSSVYLADQLLPFLATIHFHNPNELEGAIASRITVFQKTHPELLCFQQSVTFCNPLNIVQSFHANRAGEDHQHSVAELLKRFEAGERVDVSAYQGLTPKACHQEVPLQFIRP